jgi:hypothetical protein
MPPSLTAAKKKHEARLLQLPGVVSVGIGSDERGREAIVIGIADSNPKIRARLPANLEGYPVILRIVGPIKVH